MKLLVSTKLLGPYHDRIFIIEINDVKYYDISQKYYDRFGHGDVGNLKVK